MPRRRQIEPRAMQAIEDGVLRRLSAPAVEKELQHLRAGGEIESYPSLRVIQEVMRGLNSTLDPSGPWSLADTDGETPPDLLAVLREVIQRSSGRRRYMTRLEARWVERLCRLVPDLAPWDLFRLARMYIERASSGAATDDLDALVAFAPWRDGNSKLEYRDVRREGLVSQPPLQLWDLFEPGTKPRVRSRVATAPLPPSAAEGDNADAVEEEPRSNEWIEGELTLPEEDLFKDTGKQVKGRSKHSNNKAGGSHGQAG